ncbi:RTA1-domain-containing protein [Myriangium duriaei CBS 260.36]|uniref:RTA1-domain-containing protein n=1 Tax=Myriangium duriaei CBS 260.36 TaxID=1168546 RepID=A0A9P4ML87_9PEZI|nr:RTA1-domain-containing protein [Myriangium duriaei CBS 260.36]
MISLTNPYYQYYLPSVPAAVVVSALFLVLTVTHLTFVIRTRRYFGLPIVAGGTFEFVGFASRAVSHYNLTKLTPYIIQILLVLLAPILFAAGIYMFLGRLLAATKYSNYSIIRTTRLTKIFVCGDILCFLIQAYGGTKLIKPKDLATIRVGQHTILFGLALQVLIFGIFLLVAVIFQLRIVQNKVVEKIRPGVRIIHMLYTIYFASAFIMIRNIYRFVEYIMPHDGYFSQHEWPTYALDAVLMSLIMMASISWYSTDLDTGDAKSDIPMHNAPVDYQQKEPAVRVSDGRTY